MPIKISALPTQTAPDAADQLPVNDVSATTTKKMTLTVLKEWFQTLTAFVTTAMITDLSVTVAKLAANAVTLGKLDVASFTGATDANGWRLTYNPTGKRVWTKRFSQAISLGSGISFANYSLGSVPVVVGVNLASYDVNLAIVMPGGARQVSTSIMHSSGAIELGAINTFTGGAYSGTALISITITEP